MEEKRKENKNKNHLIKVPALVVLAWVMIELQKLSSQFLWWLALVCVVTAGGVVGYYWYLRARVRGEGMLEREEEAFIPGEKGSPLESNKTKPLRIKQQSGGKKKAAASLTKKPFRRRAMSQEQEALLREFFNEASDSKFSVWESGWEIKLEKFFDQSKKYFFRTLSYLKKWIIQISILIVKLIEFVVRSVKAGYALLRPKVQAAGLTAWIFAKRAISSQKKRLSKKRKSVRLQTRRKSQKVKARGRRQLEKKWGDTAKNILVQAQRRFQIYFFRRKRRYTAVQKRSSLLVVGYGRTRGRKGAAQRRKANAFSFFKLWRNWLRQLRKGWRVLRSRRAYQLATASLMVIILLVNVFYNFSQVSAATYQWTQGSWTTEDNADPASHNDDQNNWAKYYAKDAAVQAGANLSLAQANYTATDDGTFSTTGSATGGNFDNGTATNTSVSGSGTSANVALARSNAASGNGFTPPGGVTLIYRSVGPNNTSTLNTSNRTVTISGTAATFNGDMPNNVGVGDVLQYNPGSGVTLAFISSRVSATEYTVQDKNGNAPTAASAGTSVQVYRAYTSLSNAENGFENDVFDDTVEEFDDWDGDSVLNDTDEGAYNLVTANKLWNIACYADAVDTAYVGVNNRTTDATHYVRIYTPFTSNEVGTSQRHDGTVNGGGYKMKSNTYVEYANNIYITANYTLVDGIKIERSSVDWSYGTAISISTATNYGKTNEIRNCLLIQSSGGMDGALLGNGGANTEGFGNKIHDNILISDSEQLDYGIEYARSYDNSSAQQAKIYNNTIIGKYRLGAFRINVSFTSADQYKPLIKNNYVANSLAAPEYLFENQYNNTLSNFAYNACDDATCGTSNNNQQISLDSAAVVNPTFATANLSLQTSSSLKGQGVGPASDSNVPTRDSNETTRSGTTADIGADEVSRYQSSGTFESATIDLGGKADFNSINWNPVTQTANTSVDVQMATSDNADGPWSYGSVGTNDYTAPQGVTQIYRSVGPNDTSNLNISNRTVEIFGATATFSGAMPDNVGVGDVLQYQVGGTYYVVFISGRTSSTVYTVKNNVGGNPQAAAAGTAVSVYRAYTSLTNAERGNENDSLNNTVEDFDNWDGTGDYTDNDELGKDITASNEIWNIACYADAPDTDALTISGWTTSASNYLKIYTPVVLNEVGVSQRHSGVWDNSKYNISTSDYFYDTITVSSNNFVRIDGLQVRITSNYALGHSSMRFVQSTPYISNCIINSAPGSNATSANGISITGGGTTQAYIWNNIIYFSGSTTSNTNGILEDNSYVTAYNNTVSGFKYNYRAYSLIPQSFLAKNNISQNSGTMGFYEYNNTIYHDSSTNNLSDRFDAPGSNPVNNAAVSFADAANHDFHLSSNDTSASDQGIAASDSNIAFYADVDRQIRPAGAAWDIGADEYGALSAIDSSLDNHRYLRYKVTLSTSDVSVTPSLEDITLAYTQYPTAGTLTSSIYDTTDAANTMSRLQWTESVSAGVTDAKFQLRSSTNGTDWTAWCGPDDGTPGSCNSGTYFTDPSGGETLDDILTDASGDRYFQYKVFLTGDGTASPSVDEVINTYVVNAPPSFDNTYGNNGISASQLTVADQNNPGKVQISYAIKDLDSTTGSFTPNFITPTLQYSLNNGAWTNITAGNLSWAAAPSGGEITDTNSDGNLDNKVLEDGYLTYTAYWNAKAQIPETYSTNLKVRVTINDNEAANNTATATTNALTVDTKNPASSSVVINATTDPASLTLATTEDSTAQMKIGLAADLAGASWQDYNTASTIDLASDPDTAYVQFRDNYGNNTAILPATTPETPTQMIIRDVTNMDSLDYQLFLAWKAAAIADEDFESYQIYSSTNGTSYSLLTTITDRSRNYYLHADLATDTIYYYKVVTTDANGSKSYYSTVVSDDANGQGGTDTTPPTIREVSHSNVTTQSAVIKWETDELSNSTVGYSTTAGVFTTEVGVSEMRDNDDSGGVGDHQVVLTNLQPNTTYYYQVKSSDPDGAEAIDSNGGDGYSFTTTSGPVIADIAVASVSNEAANITWNTNIAATTSMVYSVHANMSQPTQVTGSEDLVTTHSVTINNLSSGTTYYFYVTSTDAESNQATDNNGGNYYSFATTSDTTAPVISALDEPLITHEKAAIYWATDEAASSQVRYGLTAGNLTSLSTESSLMSKSHYVILTGLTANTPYYYQVITEDINGNQRISEEGTFTTLKDPEYQHDPLAAISNISDPPGILTDTKVVVSFNTDQPALCAIEYGVASKDYTGVPVTESKYNENHSLHLTGLVAQTPYYYKISCQDNLGTVVTSKEYTFTTADKLQTQGEWGSSGVTGPTPTIANINTKDITGENITITWDTDISGNSLVRYGITESCLSEDCGMTAGDKDASDTNSFVAAHTITLKHLIPSTKYYYKVISYGVAGGIGQSSVNTFTTASPSTLSSIKVEEVTLTSAKISWKTSETTSSILEYGLSEEYSETKEAKELTTDHLVELSGLEQGKVYHFRVKGEDADSNLYGSSDYTFETKAPPVISDFKIEGVDEQRAIVKFGTNVPTDALITYTDSGDKYSGSQGKPDLAVKHEIELTNLAPGTTFGVKVKVRDEGGNETEEEAGSLTTAKDDSLPEISNVKSDSALAQESKVQTIISWKTNEQTQAKLLLKEDANGEAKEVSNGEAFSTAHVLVLTTLKPGKAYHFQVRAKDKADNETTSQDYVIFTPRKKENIVQIIVNNFQDIFGWTRNVGM